VSTTLRKSINGLVKLLAFNAQYNVRPTPNIESLFETTNGSCRYYVDQ